MEIQTQIPGFVIREATVADVPLILSFIRALAEYEKLLHEVVTNEPAIKFYRSIGAIPMDEWTVHRVTGDALEQLAGQF